MATKDLTGLNFGQLTVIKQAEDYIQKNGRHRKQWWCQCSCGNPNLTKVLGENLTTHHTISCGCYNKERQKETFCKRNKYNLEGEYGIGYAVDSGREFYFDLEDYDKIKDYCWSNYGTDYLTTSIKGKHCLMHQLLTDFKYPEIDHKNRKGWDNRKENLRAVEHNLNMRNQSLRKTSKSGFVGVFWSNSSKQWKGAITCNNKNYTFASSNKETVIKWRLQKEFELFGPDFAPQRHLFEQYNIPMTEEEFSELILYNPAQKEVVGVKLTKEEYWVAFITYQKHFQSKTFSGENAKENAIRWRLLKEIEFYGKEKAPQKHLFKKYGIKKENDNEKD